MPMPNLFAHKTYAAWPVWSGSIMQTIRFAPMPKKAAVHLWHRARQADRLSRQPGRHGGAVGHAALQVLHALIFDFLNFTSGRLDPSYAAIARKANVCERTVASALARLKQLGILAWVRRCAESWRDGRYVREQQTNAYAVQPESHWRGCVLRAEPPPPQAGTWGEPARIPDALAAAVIEQRASRDPASALRVLAGGRPGSLEAALASLGSALAARNLPDCT
jgi:hypothetical protein